MELVEKQKKVYGIDEHDEIANTHLLIAEAYLKREQINDAIIHYEQALAIFQVVFQIKEDHSQIINCLENLFNLYIQINNVEKSIAAGEQIIKADSYKANVTVNLACLYHIKCLQYGPESAEAKHNYKQADLNFKTAIDVEAKPPKYVDYAIFFLKHQKFTEALAQLKLAIEIMDDEDGLSYSLTERIRLDEDLQEILHTCLQDEVFTVSTRFMAQYLLVRVYLALDKCEKAEKANEGLKQLLNDESKIVYKEIAQVVAKNILLYKQQYIDKSSTQADNTNKLKIEQNIPGQLLARAIYNKYRSPQFACIKRLLYDDIFPIENSYTDLTIVEARTQKEKEQKLSTQQTYLREPLLDTVESIYQPQSSIELSAIFRTEQNKKAVKHLLIEGQTGSGKTTLLQRIASLRAVGAFDVLGEWAKEFLVIILLPLRQLYQYPATINLNQFIYHECLLEEDQQLITPEIISEELANLEKNHQVLYLLDGRNEVNELYQEKSSRGDLLRSLLRKEYWLLTSQSYYTNQDQVADRNLAVLGFSQEAIHQYVEQFFRDFNEPVKGSQLLKLKEQNITLRSAMHVPIQLELLCTVWKENGFINLDRKLSFTTFYRQIVVYLSQRMLTKYRGIDTRFLIDEYVLQHEFCSPVLGFLEEMAWTAMQQKCLLISPKIIHQLIKKYHPQDNKAWPSFYEDVFNNLGLIKATGDRKTSLLQQHYYFIHPIFQEYLAAGYVARCIATNQSLAGNRNINQLIFDEKYTPKYEIFWWFLIGILQADYSEHAAKFNQMFFQFKQDGSALYDMLLMMRCLEEDNLAETPEKKQILQQILQFIPNISKLGQRAQQRFINHINMCPNLCQEIKLELHIITELKAGKFDNNLLQIIQHCYIFSSKIIETLVELLTLSKISADANRITLLTALRYQLDYQPQGQDKVPDSLLNTLLADNNVQIKREAILIIGKLSRKNDEFMYSIIQFLTQGEDTLKSAAILTLGQLGKKDLLGTHRKRASEELFKLLWNETGWMRRYAANALVDLTKPDEAYAKYIKQLVYGRTLIKLPSGMISIRSEEEQYGPGGKVSLRIERSAFEHVSNSLSELIATGSLAIKNYFLKYLSLNKLADRKKYNAVGLVIRAFDAAKCNDGAVVEAMLLLLRSKTVPTEIKSAVAAYFKNISITSNHVIDTLQKALIDGNNHLAVKILVSEALLKLGIVNNTIINILIQGLQVSETSKAEMNVRTLAIMAVDYLTSADESLIKALIDSLKGSEYSLENIITYKGKVLKSLAKLGKGLAIVEETLLNELNKRDYNSLFILQAYESLGYLPEAAIGVFFEKLNFVDNEDNSRVAYEAGRILGKHIKSNAKIAELAKLNFSTASGEINWLLLAGILANKGDLNADALQKLLDYIKQTSPLTRICEHILIEFGHNKPAELINICLDALRSITAYSPQAWSLYRVLLEFNLSDYLAIILESHLSFPTMVYNKTPIIALLKNYLVHQDKKTSIDILKIALMRIIDIGSSLRIQKDHIVWYEAEEIVSLDIPAQQLKTFLQHIKDCFEWVDLTQFLNTHNDIVAPSGSVKLTIPFSNALMHIGSKQDPLVAATWQIILASIHKQLVKYSLSCAIVYAAEPNIQPFINDLVVLLQSVGIKVIWKINPGESQNQFANSVAESNVILAIGTPKFKEIADTKLKGSLLNMLCADLFTFLRFNDYKIVPILLNGDADNVLPLFLQDPKAIDWRDNSSVDNIWLLLEAICQIVSKKIEININFNEYKNQLGKILQKEEISFKEHETIIRTSHSPIHTLTQSSQINKPISESVLETQQQELEHNINVSVSAATK